MSGADGGAQLEQVVPMLGGLVASVRPEDLRLSTPCDAWTTRDLLNHLIGGAEMYAGAFAGEPMRDISGRLPDAIGDDPGAAFVAAATAFGEATALPGAMDRVLALPYGEMAGPEVLRFIAFDLLVHSWDLATTLGTVIEPGDELVADAAAYAHEVLGPWTRDGINFGPAAPAPAGASSLDELVAFTGRRR